MMTLAERLKAIRIRKNLTQHELAKICGITPGAIGNLETGRRKKPSYQIILKLATALEINVTELIGQPPAIGASQAELDQAEENGWGFTPQYPGAQRILTAFIWLKTAYQKADEERRAEMRAALKSLFDERTAEALKNLLTDDLKRA